MNYESELESFYRDNPEVAASLLKDLLSSRSNLVIEKFEDGTRDYRGIATADGEIKIAKGSYNPHILAHELGHVDTLGNLKHTLVIDPIGQVGNFISKYIHTPAGQSMVRLAIRLKERSANERAVELLRQSGVSPQLLSLIDKAYTSRLSRK